MTFVDLLPAFMFMALAVLLFSGFPVGFVLGGVGLLFAGVGNLLGAFSTKEFFNILVRLYGGVGENLVLTAIPMFILMGTMLERSNVARDLLYCLQVLLRRVPGGLALAVTIMGTIMAATTGIVGATVVMMTLMALPVMLNRGYSAPLATGTIGAAGTLGILIPPSIMLVIMADLLSTSVGTLFVAALLPGLMLSGLLLIYIFSIGAFKPAQAPMMLRDEGPTEIGEIALLVLKSFLPPLLLMFLVLGSIGFGWATPTEAAGVGAFGGNAAGTPEQAPEPGRPDRRPAPLDADERDAVPDLPGRDGVRLRLQVVGRRLPVRRLRRLRGTRRLVDPFHHHGDHLCSRILPRVD